MAISTYFHATNPTPFNITSTATHVVATSSFFHLNSAARALDCETCCQPQFVCHRSFVLAFASVPNARTLEAHLLTAFTNCLVPATARFADYFTTVRPGTPFEVLVLADTHIFPDDIKLLGHFFRAEPLDVSRAELLFAFELHARQVHGRACLNASLQVVAVAVDAEAMAAD